ncbi:thiopeptide-type bacteriocin biosynthesis protein [Kitasatospora phosalacinea]|uniref:thiopeptide-type bacteriocin biosynthesis protein n=1 Tax=Kitasatospora phosalacinea TaxID=2065 RepID=UPI0035E30AA9
MRAAEPNIPDLAAEPSIPTRAAGPNAPAPQGRWRTWHLHADSLRPAALEELLLRAVVPVVEGLAVGREPGGPPRPWFFLRYWQGGPHLRLRIADLDGPAADRITADLAARTDAVNAALPAEDRITPAAYRRAAGPLAELGEGGRSLELGELLPPGVHPARYEPEVRRYGGPGQMELSEELFHASSVVVLRACRTRPGHGRNVADGLEAMAATLSAWPGDRTALLRAVRDGWAEWSGGTDRAAAAERAARAAAEQADRLRASAAALAALAEGAPSRWSAWTTRLRPAAERWTELHGTPAAGRIFGSHLHMTQNRLGVGAGREGLMAGVLLELLPATGTAPGTTP